MSFGQFLGRGARTGSAPGRADPAVPSATVLGVVLAAGAGSRYGRPKALVGTWLPDRVRTLRTGGCDEVLVVLGAAAEQARRSVPAGTHVTVAHDWASGMGASLRTALRVAHHVEDPQGRQVDVALVALVDTPGLTAGAVQRLLLATRHDCLAAARVLARASYGGTPGHPVLLGRAHWDGLAASAAGDRGGRDYLAARQVQLVECGDVASGHDVDEPEVDRLAGL